MINATYQAQYQEFDLQLINYFHELMILSKRIILSYLFNINST